MTEIRTRAFVGFIGVAVAGLLTASLSTNTGCSSSSSTGTAGTSGSAGTTGHAGTSGTAGTSGSAGTTGTAGTTGAGGAVVACTAVASTSAEITDFGADGGVTTSIGLGDFYKGADTGLTAPTIDKTSGAMVVTLNTGVPSTMYPYAYFGIPFNACVDASAFHGIKFTIGGTLNTGCTIQFSTVDKGHNTVANSGTCTAASCYASAKIFTLPPTAADVTVLFADQTGGGANPGAPVVDPTQIAGFQWQVNPTAGDASSGCTGTVTIDNVAFAP